uniref:BED-type domain-containing protein n=1 Tax=Meloidogyne javanica TaxID=6303 RepID=A0A915LQR9_MELJA
MLSRSIYDFYVKRLKITQNLDPRLLLKKDLEIRSKFELVIFTEGDQQVERLVEHGKLRRKLVTIEEVFDIIHDFHNRLGHGKKMAISEAIKQDYANITLNCVLLYMANCKECYMASQLQTSTSLIETTNSDFNRELNIEDDEIIELKKVGTSKYIDYSEHFLTGQDEIRCKYCNFIYFTNSKKRPRYYLRSHLINFHKEIYNEIFANREGESVNINLEEDEEIDILNDDDGPSQNKFMRMSGDNSTTFN